MNIQIRRVCVLACFALLLTPLLAFAQVTVIFTRHAEKAASPANDPPLTAAGAQRAKLLASMLAGSGVDAIYVSELQRTQQTAAPLAARIHVKPKVIPAADTDALVKAIQKHKSGVVVVVWHSNKLPAIIAALGGPTVDIPETDYDNLFVLTVGTTPPSLLRLHYGNSAPVPPTGAKMEPATTATPVK
jgi:broad specificity phosphatase PhoE